MWLWILASALADDLNFSPDRPGVGDSTATVGAGHGMVEGGVTGVFVEGFSGGSVGVMGRFGVITPLEIRVRAPSLDFGAGVALGPVGLGAKFAGALTDQLAVSMVPEVTVQLADSGGVGASLSGNLSYAAGKVSPWLHVAVDSSVAVLVGGGIGVGSASGGFYGNAAVNLSGGAASPLVGAGGWLGLSDALQVDFGLDVTVAPVVVWQPLFGVSGGF